ncbi:hypothetical protein E7681_06010 [Thalassobius vesicularis]|uniref:Uncharacterized protein n=1 Tax=Thalassobius vesicularis TaxID=1294297 RepID=A0A4S3MBK7_9RHOB|nr:hypothetical protein E7681_06010 [Thalassobius vesicularis]
MASELILRVVILFLIGMAVLAMFGKLRLPGQKKLQSHRCPNCGRFRIGKGQCPCRKGER